MSGVDKRDRFADEVFSYRATSNGAVFISWQGKPATTLRGRAATEFLEKMNGLDSRRAQLLMARVTGNFKRGNER